MFSKLKSFFSAWWQFIFIALTISIILSALGAHLEFSSSEVVNTFFKQTVSIALTQFIHYFNEKRRMREQISKLKILSDVIAEKLTPFFTENHDPFETAKQRELLLKHTNIKTDINTLREGLLSLCASKYVDAKFFGAADSLHNIVQGNAPLAKCETHIKIIQLNLK